MNTIVCNGMLSYGLVIGGLASLFSGSAAIVDLADPRQGTILSDDTDPKNVDPRQGTILR
jgi:hypothetical protein